MPCVDSPALFDPRFARLLASAAVTAILAASLGGCQTMSDVTGAITQRADATPDDPRRAVEVYGDRYRANPKDADAALAYGQALRATGQRAQAAAVLEQATIANPGNKRAARRLRPRARRQRQFAGRLRRAEPRPFAGQSGLAHSLGAGHRARQARQARGSAQLLRHRVEDRARTNRRCCPISACPTC